MAILLEVVLKTFLFCVSAPKIGSKRGLQVCSLQDNIMHVFARQNAEHFGLVLFCQFLLNSLGWLYEKPMGHHACSYQIGGRGQGCRSSKMM
jgi:hypothetical protein